MTLTGSEHKKMICSAELESYQKRPLLPLSVANKLPIKTEHEKMSNLRNLFCMVALLLPKNECESMNVILKNYSRPLTNGMIHFARMLNVLITSLLIPN